MLIWDILMLSQDRQRIIGIDLDNTIVSYDTLFYTIALEQRLIDTTVNPGKKQIRDLIRLLPDGEIRWQQLQSVVYGPRIAEAVLIDGVSDFIQRCHAEHCPVYIVSHKTEYANLGELRVNLRQAALHWMEQNCFFVPDGLGLSRSQVLFGATRQEKIDLIKRLGCTHFIDDLKEVFQERDFPSAVTKILYTPQDIDMILLDGVKILGSWQQITEYIFH